MKRWNVLKVIGIAMVMGLLVTSGDLSAKEAKPKIRIVTTIFPFADWARQVGGEKVDVVCLLPPGASPHTYELTTKDVKAIQQADFLIYNGLEVDDWVGRIVEKSARKGLIKLALAEELPVAPMPKLIEEEEAEGHEGHDEHEADEDHDAHHAEGHEEAEHHHHHHHSVAGCGMWLDPMRAVRMVDLIAGTLGQLDPENRDYYQDNAKRYFAQLDRLDREYRQKLSGSKGGVVCMHDDMIYVFRRYNVDVYGIVEPYPGKEPSVEYLKKLMEAVAGRTLWCVISEPQLSPKPAKVLAEQLKSPMVVLDPIGGEGVANCDSYIGLMTYNLKQLTGK
jgi:zinc transport system substrate-binding protein